MNRRRGVRDLIAWLASLLALALASARALSEPLHVPDPTLANADLVTAQDFRDATYFPIKEFLAGGDPYEPATMLHNWPVRQEFDLYTPLHLTLHLPLARLPYHTALVVFSVIGLAYLIAIGLVSARLGGLPGGWPGAVATAAAVVAAQFGKVAIYYGQIDSLVGLGSVLALVNQGRPGRRAWCWGAAGLAVAWIKPQFGIPLTVLLLARGAWRQALTGTTAAGLLSLPIVIPLVVRAGGIAGFADVVRRNLDYAGHTPYAAVDSMTGARIDLAAVTYRTLGWLPPGGEAITLLGLLGLTAVLIARRRGRPFDLVELCLVGVAVLLCLPHQQSELITVPVLASVAALWLRRQYPQPLLATIAVLFWVPALHVAFAQHLVIAHSSLRVDRLIDGLCLALGYALAVVAAVAGRGERVSSAPRAVPVAG